MNRWPPFHTREEWVGAVALILAASIGIGWAAAMVLAALDDSVSDAGIQLLAAIGGVLAGAVAGYMGGASRRRNDESE